MPKENIKQTTLHKHRLISRSLSGFAHVNLIKIIQIIFLFGKIWYGLFITSWWLLLHYKRVWKIHVVNESINLAPECKKPFSQIRRRGRKFYWRIICISLKKGRFRNQQTSPDPQIMHRSQERIGSLCMTMGLAPRVVYM